MSRIRTGVMGLVMLGAGTLWVLSLGGCNTVEGLGTDLQMAGEGMRDAFRATP